MKVDFSRPVRLILCAFFGDVEGICWLVRSDKDKEGHYLLVVHTEVVEGWGKSKKGIDSYKDVPVFLIEPVDRFNPKAGVTLALLSSNPAIPTLYLTDKTKKDEILSPAKVEHFGRTSYASGPSYTIGLQVDRIVLSEDRTKAVPLSPEESEKGVLFRRIDNNSILSILENQTLYAERSINNRYGNKAPSAQHFQLPPWDEKNLQWRKKLVIGIRLGTGRTYLGIKDGKPTVGPEIQEWLLGSDPFSADTAGGCFLFGNGKFLAEEKDSGFVMTSDIDKALRVIPVQFEDASFGLRRADSLTEMLTFQYYDGGNSIRLAFMLHDADWQKYQSFTDDSTEQIVDHSPSYWLCHRKTGNVLSIKGVADGQEPRLEHLEDTDMQLWTFKNGTIVSRHNHACLALKSFLLEKERRIERCLVISQAGNNQWKLSPSGILATLNEKVPGVIKKIKKRRLFDVVIPGTANKIIETGWDIVSPDDNDPWQKWQLKQYFPTPSFKRNILDMLKPGQTFVLLNNRENKALTADLQKKTVMLETVPIEKPVGSSANARVKPKSNQLWTYNDGAIVSQGDHTLILATDNQGLFQLTFFGNKALPSQRWGVTGDFYLLHRDGRDEVATFHEKDAQLKMHGRYGGESIHESCQKWTVFPQ